MGLDPFYLPRFDAVRGVTWEAVYAGEPIAVEKAMAYGQPTGTYVPPKLGIEDVKVPGPGGPVPVRVYTPSNAAACLVWMHGGAFMFGDLDMREAHAVSAEIADRLPAVVVSVDYRLVPAFRYPAPGDDCVAVVRWAAEGGLGIDVKSLAVGGASAGANLASATALRLRDEGGPALRAVCLAYPAVHREIPEPSDEVARLASQLPPLARFTKQQREAIYRAYLGPLYDDPPPYGVPAIADLTGLPPFAIANAQFDDLRPSGEAFAALLCKHGVDVDVWAEPGTAHGYLNEIGNVTGAVATIDRFVAHLRRSSR